MPQPSKHKTETRGADDVGFSALASLLASGIALVLAWWVLSSAWTKDDASDVARLLILATLANIAAIGSSLWAGRRLGLSSALFWLVLLAAVAAAEATRQAWGIL